MMKWSEVAKSDSPAVMMVECEAYGTPKAQHLPLVQSSSVPVIPNIGDSANMSTQHGGKEPQADVYEHPNLDDRVYEVIPGDLQ